MYCNIYCKHPFIYSFYVSPFLITPPHHHHDHITSFISDGPSFIFYLISVQSPIQITKWHRLSTSSPHLTRTSCNACHRSHSPARPFTVTRSRALWAAREQTLPLPPPFPPLPSSLPNLTMSTWCVPLRVRSTSSPLHNTESIRTTSNSSRRHLPVVPSSRSMTRV